VRAKVQEEGRTTPLDLRPLPPSRRLRAPEETPSRQPLPLRRALLWGLVAAGIIAGLVLYFLYGRLMEPLVV
jgi:hypothetical protein